MRAYGAACCRRAGMAGAEMQGVKPPPLSVWYKGNACRPRDIHPRLQPALLYSQPSASSLAVPGLLLTTFFLLGFLNLRSSVRSDFPSLGSSFPRDCTWLPVSHNTDAGQHAHTETQASDFVPGSV